MSLLLLDNICGIVFCFHQIRKTQAGVRNVKSTGRESSGGKASEAIISEEMQKQLALCGKMFLILGLPWFFESIHYFAHGNHAKSSPCSEHIVEIFFRFTSCFNLLRGFFLFLIFP